MPRVQNQIVERQRLRRLHHHLRKRQPDVVSPVIYIANSLLQRLRCFRLAGVLQHHREIHVVRVFMPGPRVRDPETLQRQREGCAYDGSRRRSRRFLDFNCLRVCYGGTCHGGSPEEVSRSHQRQAAVGAKKCRRFGPDPENRNCLERRQRSSTPLLAAFVSFFDHTAVATPRSCCHPFIPPSNC